tara:strand:+ start:1020 stop:1802 length:783 start_codon:yes stop_codon:yes gene_type:complete
MTNPAQVSERKKLFVRAINQALVVGKCSQRTLCTRLDITIGTLNKYRREMVDPFDVKTRITRGLAAQLGVTTESLYNYFDTGEYGDQVDIDVVSSWIKSESGTDDLPKILNALSESQSVRSVDTAVTPIMSSTPRKPTAAEFKKLGELSAQHFEDIQRAEVLSAKKTWQLFLQQENSKLIKDEHVTGILDVFRGEEVFTLEIMQDIGFEYGRCPVLTAFRTMSDLPIKREHARLVHDCELYVAHLATKQNIIFEVQPVDG